MGTKNFEDYVTGGLIEAMDAIKDITGEPDINAVGYCLGGTLLTTTMAYLAEKKQDKRIASATFLTTLIDFEKSGDMKLFMGGNMSSELESTLDKYKVFPASKMKQTFSLLRANDMIWSFAVNNYLMGKEPFPFDLLYWNNDATNLPAAMHRFYLKNMYQDNVLKNPGGITIDGVKIDVRKIKTPCYFLSTREDHIAP
jgi:polyhydroxyalkanoate synthase